MKFKLTVICLFVLLYFNSFAQMTCINGTVRVLASGYSLNCVYAVPKNFDATKSYPLILFFHGSGEAGTNINTMYNQGLPNVLKSGYQPPFDFIMVAPQASSYGVNPDWLPYILADVKSRYKIDSTRIYGTGLSAGGWATFGSQMNEPLSVGKQFAAIAPLSAATQDLTQSGVSNFSSTKVFVWDVVGATDVSYVANNQTLCNNINALVPNLAQFYTRPNIGHGNWIDIYNSSYRDPNGKSIYDFLYSHILGNAIAPPVITSPSTATGTVGVPFNYPITATGNPNVVGADNIPTGLTLQSFSITGTPTTAGTSIMHVAVTNGGGTTTMPVTVTIANPLPTVVETITLYSDGTYKKQ